MMEAIYVPTFQTGAGYFMVDKIDIEINRLDGNQESISTAKTWITS